MKASFIVACVCVASLTAASAVSGQDVPADYQQVLSTLGKQGGLQGQRFEGQHPSE